MLKKKPKISDSVLEGTLDSQVERAISCLRKGEIIAFPTETCFGLGVDIENEAAILKLFQIKNRSLAKPILVLINDIVQLDKFVTHVPKKYTPLIKRFWPGPLTLIFPAKKHVSSLLTGNTGTIGVRLSSDSVSKALCRKFNKPVTATSANISGNFPAHTRDEVLKQFGSKISYILDCSEEMSVGERSTIVAERKGEIVIIREGVIPVSKILQIFD